MILDAPQIDSATSAAELTPNVVRIQALDSPNNRNPATFGQLSSALEDLLHASDSPLHKNTVLATESDAIPGAPILDAIDSAFALWQAKVAVSFNDSATAKLTDQLDAASLLLSQIETRETATQRRDIELSKQRDRFESKLADLLRGEAKLERQRRTIARSLRREKSEGQRLLKLERQEMLEAIEDQASQRARDLVQVEHESQLAEHARTTSRLQSTQRELESAQQKISELESEPGLETNDFELLERIEELEQTNARLIAAKKTQTNEIAAAADSENARLAQQLADASDQLETQSTQIANGRLLQDELDAARQQIQRLADQQTDADQAARLRHELVQQLDEARSETEQLRQRNTELAAEQQTRAGGSAPHVSFDQTSLSWEERKKLILQQLDAPQPDGTSAAEWSTQRIEINSLVKTTQAEIQTRDKEIAELQAIVEQQSNTAQGVAIGAAAIPQMFDADELICQEREKIKLIQLEWEQKVRQAEIDISLERAKLARDKSELETKVADFEAHGLPEPPVTNATGGRKRKWLDHLGLRDDSDD